MTIAVGDRLPDATFHSPTPNGPVEKTVADVFDGKKVVLFAVPGAYTPTCNGIHLPGFVTHLDAFAAKGIDTIACTSTNDAFVLDAWAKSTGADGKIVFLADGNAAFAKAVGLDLDASGISFGTRSKRYVMVVDDRVVKSLAVEDQPGKAEMTSAEGALAAL